MVGEQGCVGAKERLEAAALAPVDDERLVAPEKPVMDEYHLGAGIGRVLEERLRARDPADHELDLVAPDHLEPRRGELRPTLHVEQSIRIGDDLVSVGHAHSL